MYPRNRSLAMPAIYNFRELGEPAQESWGWHSASELFEAVNTILVHQGGEESRMTALEMGRQFSFIDPMLVREMGGPVPSYNIITPLGHMQSCSVGKGQWLHFAVSESNYVPARLGVELIKAAKQPRRSAIRRVFVAL